MLDKRSKLIILPLAGYKKTNIIFTKDGGTVLAAQIIPGEKYHFWIRSDDVLELRLEGIGSGLDLIKSQIYSNKHIS